MAEMKVPGPDHPIAIAPYPGRVVIRLGDTVVAETGRALQMREKAYRPVFYVPRADADMACFTRTDHATYCPYKGYAAYFSLAASGLTAENAVWTYEAPYPAVAEIADHLAFYPDKVEIVG